jgi:hypothetical protein
MRSTFLIFIVLFSVFVFGCTTEKLDIDPTNYFDTAQLGGFKYKVIRYAGDLPRNGNHDNKFDSSYNDHYKKLSAAHQLRFYYEDAKSGYRYFLLTRIAPSLTEKYVAVGGKLKMSADSLTSYEEVFRTWKMPEEEQLKTAEMLFRKMLKGEDLSKYYPENSGEAYIIEFPSKRYYFDTTKRRWLLEELRGKKLPNMVR